MVVMNRNRRPVMIRGGMLDALPRLATLYLPPKMAWTDDLAPALPRVKHLVAPDTVFAAFPDFALPTLEHAECAKQVMHLRTLPAACVHTLKQITADTFHVRLIAALSCAPQLNYFQDANRIGIDGDFPLDEWRLAYVQGNPIWRRIPSLTVRLNAANKPVRKLVIEVRTVDDVGKMVKEIATVVQWCVWYQLAAGPRTLQEVQQREAKPEPFPVDIHVAQQAGTIVHSEVKKMIEALDVEEVVGRMIVIPLHTR
ncbi:hypothetical protein GGF32_005640 [Allomyces javanicus]|nr:hypothetical protein GGF32_005640 [Allomyces javanicus]